MADTKRQFIRGGKARLVGRVRRWSPVQAQIVSIHNHLRLVPGLGTGQAGIQVRILRRGVVRPELQASAETSCKIFALRRNTSCTARARPGQTQDGLLFHFSTLFTVTVASPTTAPDASSTFPEIPAVTCARARPEQVPKTRIQIRRLLAGVVPRLITPWRPETCQTAQNSR